MALDMHSEVKAMLLQLQPGVAVYGGGTISNRYCSYCTTTAMAVLLYYYYYYYYY